MSRRPKRSRAEQRTPTVEMAGPRIEMGQDYYVGPKDSAIVADPPATGPGCDECAEVREELLHTTTAFHCQTCGFTQAPQPRGGRIVELGAPFDEELPALPAEALAAAGPLSHVDAPEGGLKAGDTVAVSIVPLPAWWPEDADQQAAIVAACDAFDLGYNEINGARFDGSTLVLVTVGGSKVRWPEDVGRATLSDMQRGRPHDHTGPGRQFPNGYLRRDPRRDPKE